MLLGTDSSFDDDDDKYQKMWIRATRVKVVVGLVVICLFVIAVRYLPSATSQSGNAEPHLRTKVTTIDNRSSAVETPAVVTKVESPIPPAVEKPVMEKVQQPEQSPETNVNVQPVKTSVDAESLMKRYLQRPAVFQVSQSATTSYPKPAPEVDEMCKAQYPEPIPPLSPSLKSVVDKLLNEDASLLSSGRFSFEIPEELAADYHNLNEFRASHIRDATCFTWANYRQYAWGHDELFPMRAGHQDNWGGVAMTAIDSLDTLYLMGLKKEVKSADEIVKKLNFDLNRGNSLFELNIRIVGGLLAMYDLTHEKLYLEKAEDLASRMLPAFETPSGYPLNSINLRTGRASAPNWTGGNVLLSEVGTVSVEFLALADRTGKRKYRAVIDKIYDSLKKAPTFEGMLPMRMSPNSGNPMGGPYSLSGGADSYYEYLVKMWILEGKKDETIRSMYNEAVEGITKRLLRRNAGGLLYTAELEGGVEQANMGHLACFAGGMLALGVFHNINPATRERDLANAKSLAYTCYRMYISTPSGVGGESMSMNGEQPRVNSFAPYYILRPEALETMYYLNQITGDPIYREWGWKMWEGIERSTKVEHGFSHIRNVNNPSSKDDKMESFFLGETMKYLYLLFKDDKIVDISKQVFNTEAHPVSAK